MTGKGVYCFANGDRCVGTYVNGKKEGQGTMFYASVRIIYSKLYIRYYVFIYLYL